MFSKLIASLVLSSLALSATAEPVIYQLEGYFASKKEGADPNTNFGPTAMVSEAFVGTMTYDAERQLHDAEIGEYYSAPLIELSLTGTAGTIIRLGGNNTSRLSASRADGVEQLRIWSSGVLDVAGRAVEGDALLQWSSTQIGQLPANLDALSSVDPPALQPRSWTLTITNRGECPPWCELYLVSQVKAHITRISPQGEQPSGSYTADFRTRPAGWSDYGGSWVSENGIYRNLANVPLTSSVYTGQQLGTAYRVATSFVSGWSASGNTAGLLLHYRDAANFDEIRFSPTGRVTYNQVRNGARRTLQSASHAVPVRTLADISVTRSGATANVRVFGQDVFTVNLGSLTGGHAGVFASWNMVQVHTFGLAQSQSTRWAVDRYTSGPVGRGLPNKLFTGDWTAITGTWQDMGDAGYYYSSSNLPAAISTYDSAITGDYTIDASVYLEWSASGNLGGVVYDYRDASNYRAVLISAGRLSTNGVASRGRFEVREVREGRLVSRYQVDGPFSLAREYTPVGLRRMGDLTEVTAFGVRVVLKQPAVTGAKRAGLMTSYNKVRFDEALIGVAR